MNHSAYPRYKESGVQWLDEVPEHWEVKRLKYSASINDEALSETTNLDFEFSYVDIGSVHPVNGITNREPMIFENAPSRARRRVKVGDTIVSTVRTYLRAIAPIPETNETLIVSTGFAVIRPRKVNSEYLGYALREASFVESIVSRSVGVSYPAIIASDIGLVSVPLPSDPEQTTIADFLDRETGKIDTLMAKKRQLIDRLKEKRTALISRTVTRGLPTAVALEFDLEPHTRFKDSGIEWLGEVPEGWEIKRLKYLFQCFGGGTPSKANSAFWDGRIPWVSPKDMSDKIISDTEDHITEEAVIDSATRIVSSGATLVVVRSGILRHTIPVATNLVPVTLNQDMKALVSKGIVTNAHLAYFIQGHNKSLLGVCRIIRI